MTVGTAWLDIIETWTRLHVLHLYPYCMACSAINQPKEVLVELIYGLTMLQSP